MNSILFNFSSLWSLVALLTHILSIIVDQTNLFAQLFFLFLFFIFLFVLPKRFRIGIRIIKEKVLFSHFCCSWFALKDTYFIFKISFVIFLCHCFFIGGLDIIFGLLWRNIFLFSYFLRSFGSDLNLLFIFIMVTKDTFLFIYSIWSFIFNWLLIDFFLNPMSSIFFLVDLPFEKLLLFISSILCLWFTLTFSVLFEVVYLFFFFIMLIFVVIVEYLVLIFFRTFPFPTFVIIRWLFLLAFHILSQIISFNSLLAAIKWYSWTTKAACDPSKRRIFPHRPFIIFSQWFWCLTTLSNKLNINLKSNVTFKIAWSLF